MKKGNRILAHEEFLEVEKSPTSLRTPDFVVYKRKSSLDKLRVGISVSKKNGNAVRRNLIKRQVRCMLDAFLNLEEAADLVVIVRRNYDPEKFHDNKEELGKALAALGEKL